MRQRAGTVTATCSIHGPLTSTTCEPCDVAAYAQTILDPHTPQVPQPWPKLQKLAKYALRAIKTPDPTRRA